jgi:hypothetical protein
MSVGGLLEKQQQVARRSDRLEQDERYFYTRTTLSVERWDTHDRLTGNQARLRREHLRRRYVRGIPPRQPLQSLNALVEIPRGTPVVAHLWRPAKRHPSIHGLVAHGLQLADQTPARSTAAILKSEHVGRTYGPFRWQPWMATASWQNATRCVFFDPGDAVLEHIYRGSQMSIEEYVTSKDEPAIVISPNGNGRSFRFESQPDGFGVVWPTQLDAVAALSRAMAVLSAPEADDQATIASPNSGLRTCPTHELVECLQSSDVTPSLVHAEIGSASLAWARALDEDSLAQMSFGDDYYVRGQVKAMLGDTADLPPGLNLDAVLSAADDALRAHLPPQS